MFWTDWGSPAKVERAYMDGTRRTTIADTSLVWPNDITIDYGVGTISARVTHVDGILHCMYYRLRPSIGSMLA